MASGRHDREEIRRRFAAEARAERPDLALLCLLLAAEADPALDANGIDAAQIELDRLAGLLPYGLRGGRAWASALAELLGERYGFEGSSAEYQRLESSLLHEVLRQPARAADPAVRGVDRGGQAGGRPGLRLGAAGPFRGRFR